jgi:hypothetical protein
LSQDDGRELLWTKRIGREFEPSQSDANEILVSPTKFSRIKVGNRLDCRAGRKVSCELILRVRKVEIYYSRGTSDTTSSLLSQ